MKKAIIYGASGLVGSHIVETLLNDARYEQVIIVVRKDTAIRHPKLKIIIGDLHSFADVVKGIPIDEVYIALGTTQKKTPDQKEYYQIDHDYPVSAAKSAKENGAKTVLLVSSVGADVKSSVFYTRTKGETERDIISLGLEHTYIFRPSMILGDRKEKRPLELFIKGIWRVINPLFVGGISRYKGIEARDIARAMVNAANGQEVQERVRVLHWGEMKGVLR